MKKGDIYRSIFSDVDVVITEIDCGVVSYSRLTGNDYCSLVSVFLQDYYKLNNVKYVPFFDAL